MGDEVTNSPDESVAQEDSGAESAESVGPLAMRAEVAGEATSAAHGGAAGIDAGADDPSADGSNAASGTDAGQAAPADPGPFEIAVDYREQVMYAFAHNRIPTIRSISIRNVGGVARGTLTVSVRSEWAASDRSAFKPSEFTVDCPAPGQQITVERPECLLDDIALADLEEAAPATLLVSVRGPHGETSSVSAPLTVLARTQMSLSSRDSFLVAAFIQPNHPAVKEVLQRASAIALQQTTDGRLQGYQSGPDRAREIARAIFCALQERIKTYINPPAGHEVGMFGGGQKLRPLDEVLAGGMGTCFDLACAYASCLEQAGLHPIVYMVHGHAFAGFFTDDRDDTGEELLFDSEVEANLATIEAWFAAGRIVGVETTAIPSDGAIRDVFDLAVADTERHFAARDLRECDYCNYLVAKEEPASQDPHMEAAIDIRTCRTKGVRPIPARVREGDVVNVYIDNGPVAPPTVERRDARTFRVLPNQVPARVQQWKNSLLDLSFRNPLLNFKPASRGVELVIPKGRLGDIEDALIEGEIVGFPDVTGLSDRLREAGYNSVRTLVDEELQAAWDDQRWLFSTIGSENDKAKGTFQARVKNLASKAKSEEQDTGVNNLHLALGSLSWTDPKSAVGAVTSPIFLVPIRIQWSRGAQVPVVRMQEDGMTTVNYSLIEALRAKVGMKLEWFRHDMSDERGLDIKRGLEEIRSELLKMGLVRNNGFEVREDAGIGRLVFSKVRLWRDLDEHWDKLGGNAAVKHLVDGAARRFVDPADPDARGIGAYDDTTLISPQPADGAQTRAIVRALAGHTFVLEGPPGTGKSQTITNLLANALAAGKKVLFVAEKQAALEVVQERLEQVGLDPFCLELHDKGAKPEEVKSQLRTALDFQPTDVTDAWDRNEAMFAAAAAALAEYRRRIHEPTPEGRSYFHAYRALLELGEGETVPVGRSIVEEPAERVRAIRQALVEAPVALAPARPRPRHPWSLARERDRDRIDRESLAAAVTSLARDLESVNAMSGSWRSALDASRTSSTMSAVAAAVRVAHQGRLPQRAEWRDIASAGWWERLQGAAADAETSLEELAALGEGSDPGWLQSDWTAARDAVSTAAASFVVGRKGRLRVALGALAANPVFADVDADGAVQKIQALAAAADRYRSAVITLATLSGFDPQSVDGVPSTELIEGVRSRAAELVEVAHVVTVEGEGGALLLAAIEGPTLPPADIAEAVDGVARAFSRITECVAADAESITHWLDQRPVTVGLAECIGEWNAGAEGARFLELGRWSDALRHLEPLEVAPTVALRSALLAGELSAEEAAVAFDRASLLAVLEVVGETYTLDVFDQHAQNRQVDRFIAALSERQTMLRSLIPARLFDSRTFTSSAGTGMVAEFRTELTSKRRGARSIRALIQKYPDIISSLTPCFLMSPDSVAKFIVPGTIHFDMVVFDEASQIRVADAVGAMGRATSVVVVGDSKQMPPTSIAVAGGADPEDEPVYGENEPVTTDAESILDECTEAGFDSEMLSWHYRSKDELLIAFSNGHYYGGGLASFPAPAAVAGCGVEYRRVNGQFDHGRTRTNAIEADAIVAEVVRRVNDPVDGQYTIGIVTLNAEQQKLVRDKLEALGDPMIAALLERDDDRELIIKNLESVQGQERDVIILGTSFSKRISGEKMPLNFGPLTQSKGERRLNVAVTRARRLLMVFSSFEPSELSDAKSVGMVHLREYLEMAKQATEDRRAVIEAARSSETDLYVHDVAAALEAKGLRVQVGFGLSKFRIDIAVSTAEFPDRWLVGVLLDGEEWGDRALVLDRDALPVTVLKNAMGWPMTVRVWLPAWRFRRDEVVSDILDAVVEAEELVRNPPPPPEPVVVPSQSRNGGDAPAIASEGTAISEAGAQEVAALPRSDRARPFEPPGPPSVTGSSEMLDYPTPQTAAALREIIERWGPLGANDAVKALAKAFGLSRVAESRVQQLMPLVPADAIVTTPFGDYLFPRDLVEADGSVVGAFSWYRTSTFKERAVEAIPPHEIANAMVELVTASFSIEPEELANVTLTTFGYKRRGGGAVEHLLQVAAWAADEGYFALADGRYIVGSDS